MKEVFNYHSEQKHEIICKDGVCTKKVRRVTIKNGSGVKEVIVKGPKGPARKSVKKLTKREVRDIKKQRFIPGLFKGL
jgi:hypothetical protein